MTIAIPGHRTESEQAKRFGRGVRTLILWRKQGRIGFTKVGNTVLYSDKHEAEFLKSNSVSPVRPRSRRERTAA